MRKGVNDSISVNSKALKMHKAKNGIIYNVSAWMLAVPTLLAMIFFHLYPMITGFVYSTFSMKAFTPQEFVGLANFKYVLEDMLFNKALLNTLQYVIWSLVIGFIPPIFVSVLLNELPVFKSSFRFLVYFPSIIPGMVASMLWVFLYYPNESGLLNMILNVFGADPQIWLDNKNLTIPLLIVSSSWTGIGGTTIYYLAAMQGLNRELYEASMIDGAGILTRFFKVMLPQMMPIFLLFLVRQMIGVFGIMSEPLVMTGGGPDNSSLSLSLLTYNYTFTYGYVDKGLALGVIQFFIGLIMTVFYLFLERKFND